MPTDALNSLDKRDFSAATFAQMALRSPIRLEIKRAGVAASQVGNSVEKGLRESESEEKREGRTTCDAELKEPYDAQHSPTTALLAGFSSNTRGVSVIANIP